MPTHADLKAVRGSEGTLVNPLLVYLHELGVGGPCPNIVTLGDAHDDLCEGCGAGFGGQATGHVNGVETTVDDNGATVRCRDRESGKEKTFTGPTLVDALDAAVAWYEKRGR